MSFAGQNFFYFLNLCNLMCHPVPFYSPHLLSSAEYSLLTEYIQTVTTENQYRSRPRQQIAQNTAFTKSYHIVFLHRTIELTVCILYAYCCWEVYIANFNFITTLLFACFPVSIPISCDILLYFCILLPYTVNHILPASSCTASAQEILSRLLDHLCDTVTILLSHHFY